MSTLQSKLLSDDSHVVSSEKSAGPETTILVLVGWYLPGYKAGGPIRSIANIVESLGDEFRYKIVTSDRDLGDRLPYPDVVRNRWVQVGKAQVMYLPEGVRGVLKLITLLCLSGESYVLYLNSLFSRRFSMFPLLLRRLGLIHPVKVLLAPRGELSLGALDIKSGRKRIYCAVSRAIGLHKRIVFHASSTLEAKDIQRAYPSLTRVMIASPQPGLDRDIAASNRKGGSIIGIAEDISPAHIVCDAQRMPKRSGFLRIVFVSRISPKKNLIGALKMLRVLTGEISFNIYGSIEEESYWKQCEKQIAALPANVQVKYRGAIQHEKVVETFAMHDLFLFPTMGENYGHVICESLKAGCPVLISDRTFWQNLAEEKVGWCIPIDRFEEYRTILQDCVYADDAWRLEIADRARKYIHNQLSSKDILESNRRLFRCAINGKGTLIHTGSPATDSSKGILREQNRLRGQR